MSAQTANLTVKFAINGLKHFVRIHYCASTIAQQALLVMEAAFKPCS